MEEVKRRKIMLVPAEESERRKEKRRPQHYPGIRLPYIHDFFPEKNKSVSLVRSMMPADHMPKLVSLGTLPTGNPLDRQLSQAFRIMVWFRAPLSQREILIPRKRAVPRTPGKVLVVRAPNRNPTGPAARSPESAPPRRWMRNMAS